MPEGPGVVPGGPGHGSASRRPAPVIPVPSRPGDVTPYVGRFAPAPTGPLHFGSVVTALASWLRARQARGRWLVRIEDLDTVRAIPGSEEAILAALERLGLHPDGEVVRQSCRQAVYREALARMEADERCYPCACSRREVGGGRYPGTCRAGVGPGREAVSRRLNVAGCRVTVHDAVLGDLTQDLDTDVGDFVVQRGDGLIAYHLAVVVDDALQGVTEIVRGADIWPVTPRQVELQRTLGLPTPAYVHVPVAVGPDGRKLSKQNAAPAIDPFPPGLVLRDAFAFLGLEVETPAAAPVAGILAEGRERWTLERLPKVAAQAAPDRYVGAGQAP